MATDATHTYTQSSRPTWLILLTIIILWGLLAGFILMLAQDWTLGWIYFGLFAAGSGISKGCLLIWNRGLYLRRMRIGSGTKTWDYPLFALMLANLFAVIFVAVRDFDMLAGDIGSRGIVWLIGLIIYISGWSLFAWSGVANPFFELTVRIQEDQAHHVIDQGPYAYIRHPGYVGFGAVMLSTPLLLPSFWIWMLSLLAALLLVIRTALEDRTLQAELDGYAEYATRVRFRLIPGVW